MFKYQVVVTWGRWVSVKTSRSYDAAYSTKETAIYRGVRTCMYDSI